MFEFKVNYKDHDFTIVIDSFEYIPAEKETTDCPASRAYVEIYDGVVLADFRWEDSLEMFDWSITSSAFDEIIKNDVDNIHARLQKEYEDQFGIK